MAALATAFLTWAAVAAAAVFWALRLFVPGESTPTSSIPAPRPDVPQVDLSRLLGSAPPTAQAREATAAPAGRDGRFRLIGVVARDLGIGIALLSIDGKPGRAFRVGAPVDGDWVLQQVGLLSATLGPAGGTAALTLSLPPAQGAVRGAPNSGGAATGTVALPAPGGGVRPFPNAFPSPGPATAPAAGSLPPESAAGSGAAEAESGASASTTPDGRVPSPEPGMLRRPGPLTR